MITVTGYELGERLHDSARSMVYRARRLSDDLPVVVKMLKAERLLREDLGQLKREYEILRRFDVGGVIRASALERSGVGLALVLEDFGARSLRSWAQGRVLPVMTALEVALRIARALREIHGRGVIHKDVNPSNVVIHPTTLEVKLIDFGISTALTRETPAIRALGRLEGTLPYLSPEQTGRMNRSLDSRTDLYSFGATLYELLTGTLPFATSDPVEMVHAHIAREPEPPHLRRPDVPLAVSRVVLKLLAKAAEDRYQSAAGVQADLETCLEALKADRAIPDFVPGERDVPDRLHLAQRLYGREKELKTLLDTFERAAQGESELLLVSGYSGIGKSALVHEVQKPIVERRGYFASGKFEQLTRDRPYAALIQAFGDLTRQLLTEPEESLAVWRGRIAAALGPNGGVLSAVIPEIELIVGKQAEVEPLGLAESQNRWNLVFQRFVQCFASEAHPLVLFLDDLQWADGPSLKLLSQLCADRDVTHLFVIGAYRDNEVTAGHPLVVMLDELRRAGAHVGAVTLGPLTLPDVTALVVDTFRVAEADARPLASLASEKTGGNPFFLGQFLKEAASEGLITFDASTTAWRWDVGLLRARGITENVVELMASKILRLGAGAQRALQLASCIGARFDLRTLALLLGQSLVDTARELWEPAHEGLIVPIDDDGHHAEPAGHEEMALLGEMNVSYQFLHDRVQQAAYSLLAEGDRTETHLRLGRLLASHLGTGAGEHVFDVVNQYNHGAARLTESDERLRLARLNLSAARKAKAAAAYESALRYLEVGLSLLPETAWDTLYELAFELHVDAMEAALLSAQLERADALSGIALSHARTAFDKARVHEPRMLFHTAKNDFAAAIEAGLLALSLLGDPLDTDIDQATAFGSVLEMEELVAGRSRASLADLPAMTDETYLARMRVLTTLTAPVYIARPVLFMPVVCRLASLSVRHGNGPLSPFGYAEYGLIRAAIGDTESANEWGTLALKLLDRYDVRALRAKIHVLVSAFITHFKVHLRESTVPLRDSVQQGMDVGDLEFAGYGADLYCTALFYLGEPVDRVIAELGTYIELLARLKQEFQRLFGSILRQGVMSLVTDAEDPLAFEGPSFDERTELAPLVAGNLSNLLCLYHSTKLQLGVIFGDHERAAEHGVKAEPHLGAMAAHFTSVQHGFYSALAQLGLAAKREGNERAACLEKAEKHLAVLAGQALHGPENHLHKLQLVQAEKARVEGRTLDAMDLYEKAIARAAEQKFLHEEALAYELAAGLYVGLGRLRIASGYLGEARARYLEWGATAKVAQLEKRVDVVLPQLGREAGEITTLQGASTSTDRIGTSLDLATVMKAARAISGEIVLGRLLDNLMRIAIENAGAQQGFLVLERDGNLVVAAEHHGAQGEGVSTPEIPLEQEPRISHGIVQFVHRTRDSVVLGDASREGLFVADPHVAAAQTRSVLCAPLLHRGQVAAILYLENNLIPHAFTEGRLELLRMLSSQAALSITNARLYADLGAAKARLEEYTHGLEAKVEERTAELVTRNAELATTLTQLRETQQQLATRDKLALLGSLTAGIAHELKNPLNFINNFASLSVELTQEIEEGIRELPKRGAEGQVELDEALHDLRGNVTKINEYGKRADSIINAMLMHSRQAPSPRGAANLNDVVRESVNLAYHGARARDAGFSATIKTLFDPEVGMVDLSVPDVSRVFINVLDNALYAIRKKKQSHGASYVPELSVRTVSAGDRVEVRIRDNGPGIPDDVVAQVFNPFFTTKPPGEGTGLGLSLSHDIMVAHQGELRVETVLGESTEIIASFPRVAPPRPSVR